MMFLFIIVFAVVTAFAFPSFCAGDLTHPVQENIVETHYMFNEDGNYSVPLSSITPPVWNEEFCVLECADSFHSISWGVADEGCIFAESSGYPGFGVSMLIRIDFTPTSYDVEIDTDYGVYQYRITEHGEAVLNDAKTDIIDYRSGEKIINFSKSGENLYLFNELTRTYYSAELVRGTLITDS